jgi:hypothetical protein
MYINNKYKSGQGLALQTEKTNFSANAFLLGKILSQPVCDRPAVQFMDSATRRALCLVICRDLSLQHLPRLSSKRGFTHLPVIQARHMIHSDSNWME